jgi:hypothetical protein
MAFPKTLNSINHIKLFDIFCNNTGKVKFFLGQKNIGLGLTLLWLVS